MFLTKTSLHFFILLILCVEFDVFHSCSCLVCENLKVQKDSLNLANKMEPLVLDLLFENLDVTLLKSCRLVCKEWYELSLIEWRKRAVVCIGNVSGSPLKPPCARIPGRAKVSLKEWNKVWAREDAEDLLRLREVPFRNFKLWDWSEWGVAETIFMKQSGPSMRQLEFVNCDFTQQTRSFQGFVDDVTLFMRLCGSSIRKLRFEECGFKGLIRSFSWPQFVRSVAEVRELFLPKVPLSSFISILRSIGEMRSGDKTKFQLRRLSLSIGSGERGTMPQHVRQIVQEMKWPLKQVSIELEDGCDVDEIILGAYRNTLEVIRVCEPSSSLGWLYNEVFPSLKKLELIWRTKEPNLLLTFLKRMPNLKELILKPDMSDDTPSVSDLFYWIVPITVDKDSEMATLTFPSMESLHFISWNQGVFDPPTVAQIVTWMPNLKRLTIPVEGSCLSILFANLKQLEELKTLVLYPHDLDNFETFFTGYSPNEEGILEKVAPGISDLTNLTTFSLLTLYRPGWTDFCFSYGFLRMPRLQSIFISVDDDAQVSQEMRSRIKSTFPRGVIKNPKNKFGPFGEILCEYTHNFVDVNSEGSRCCSVCVHRCENCPTLMQT